MTNSKLTFVTLCLFGFLFISSAFTSNDNEAEPTIFASHMDSMDCISCHASWMQSGSGTESEYIQMNHEVSINFFNNYIASYTPTAVNNSGVDIKKLTKFIDSL